VWCSKPDRRPSARLAPRALVGQRSAFVEGAWILVHVDSSRDGRIISDFLGALERAPRVSFQSAFASCSLMASTIIRALRQGKTKNQDSGGRLRLNDKPNPLSMVVYPANTLNVTTTAAYCSNHGGNAWHAHHNQGDNGHDDMLPHMKEPTTPALMPERRLE
jgi:hypothetical protein